MKNQIDIRSISFDTSFLLKNNKIVDEVINILKKEKVQCYITSTVVSELEQLRIWGRITQLEYNRAIKRWKNTHATVIDFQNRFLSNGFGKKCIKSMEKHHGVKPNEIINDCNILVTSLKNGIDIFISEDYHFTSRITKKVIDEVSNSACKEFHMMCKSILYNIDSKTFIKSYKNNKIDVYIIEKEMKLIKKSEKRYLE